MKILITGGAGYIGSHTVVELLGANHQVVVVDNLTNSSAQSLQRVQQITGKEVSFVELDLQNKDELDQLFSRENFDAVIHFAGLKAVGESVQKPLLYYRVNLDSTLSLLEAMALHGVHKLVFSSSATVYGSSPVPYSEENQVGVGITSPYGQTKYMIERIIENVAKQDPKNEFSILRYFNPIGAHESGLIGEDPKDVPNNIMPYISQVASGKQETLSIFGNDYDTPDGTCVRDYIHVVDLAKGHLAALTHLSPSTTAYNLGSGKGTSVVELVKAFQAATGQNVPYSFEARRAGDLPAFYADVSKANNELQWQTTKSIEQMCADTWRWQSMNPNGFSD